MKLNKKLIIIIANNTKITKVFFYSFIVLLAISIYVIKPRIVLLAGDDILTPPEFCTGSHCDWDQDGQHWEADKKPDGFWSGGNKGPSVHNEIDSREDHSYTGAGDIVYNPGYSGPGKCQKYKWYYCDHEGNSGCTLCNDRDDYGVCATKDFPGNCSYPPQSPPPPTSPPQPTVTPIPPASVIPNCTALAGPSSIVLGQSGTYIATFSSPQGNLGAEIVAGQAGVMKWNPCYETGSFNESLCRIPGPGAAGSPVFGPKSFTWTPTAVGTYDILCRAWNDSVAECRGEQNYVDGPPRYLCDGPISSMTVTVVGPSAATVTPGGPTLTPAPTNIPGNPGNCPLKNLGDANCDGKVDEADFKVWLSEFDTMVPASPPNQNADFACVEGNTQTYFVDLTSFEIWRRNTTSGLISGNNGTPTPTITPGGPTLTLAPPTPTTAISSSPTQGGPTDTPVPNQPSSTPVPPTSVPTSGPTVTNRPCTSNAECGDGKDDPQNWYCDFSYTHQCYHEKPW